MSTAMADLTDMELAQRRLTEMKRQCLAARVAPDELQFRGLPISQFSRESLLVMLAYQTMRGNKCLGAYASYSD